MLILCIIFYKSAGKNIRNTKQVEKCKEIINNDLSDVFFMKTLKDKRTTAQRDKRHHSE